MNLILPSEVLGLQGFSEDVYAQDLFAIFSASPASNGKVEMHKVWFESRKPTIDELWASRHPTRGGYQKTTAAHILRKVLTLSMLLEKATTGMLVRKLQTLLMDHLMLMCITYTSMERPLHYFPDYEARFLSLVETVGTTEPSVPGNIKTSNIPPEVRAKLENLCIDSTTVTPLDQISGNVEGRRMIERAIFLPTRAAHYAAEGLGSQGILLHGPPGTGKTLLAMASAAESEKCKVYSALSSDLIEKWQGTSEQNIVALFTIAAENAPAVIVVDEVEGLCRSRQSKSTSEGSSHRIANAFLASMTKYKGVVVIGTTNLPWELDHAFARRFDTKVHVGLPSEAERLAMTQLRLRRFNHGLSEVEMRRFAQECLGFTGAAVIRTINAALQELVLEFKSATHFRPASTSLPVMRGLSLIGHRLRFMGEACSVLVLPAIRVRSSAATRNLSARVQSIRSQHESSPSRCFSIVPKPSTPRFQHLRGLKRSTKTGQASHTTIDRVGIQQDGILLRNLF